MSPTGQRATTPTTSGAGATTDKKTATKTAKATTSRKPSPTREQPATRAQPATRDRERTRRALLEATDQLLHERGTGFSLADVAARAEVSKGGLLYHFPTRDALIIAVVEAGLARFRDEVMAHVDLAENRPGKVLRGYVRALCGSSQEAVNTFAPSAWNGVDVIAEVADLLHTDANWWRETFARDGLDPQRTLIVQFAAEGVAAALAMGAYINDDEIGLARDGLLALTEAT
ncbi:TetR/AcrR family transcriptional regulator [Kineococcus radiotolerans]|uniref:Transcriptional regulator, TetR family n=1 Tax=Kineococcus radiotolerans (strain ATCC BAA-149 / DSM 14245 / SRS30216) TaxID=266940 RepID=A6WAW6_KINRD|nr:TetR/AcrR family transcriptional regulator [Kineococcus radiotolerans]ABS03955.1 transcriptional regulator, TetR family [Kineococcus radiotolerans SRS30216 = ATCC BAA-149]